MESQGRGIQGYADGIASIVKRITALERAASRHPLDVEWMPLTLSSPWTNFGNQWEVCEFAKAGSIVFLRGLARTDVSTPVNSRIASLDDGYRPPAGLVFDQRSDDGDSLDESVRVNVDADGSIYVSQSRAAVGWLSLSGIWFSVN